MENFDLIVIGSGAGINIVSAAASSGMKVALVESGPLGGTCLNRGCIPSKMWTYPADVIRGIEDAARVGVHAKLEKADFEEVRRRTWDLVLADRHNMAEALSDDPNVRLFPASCRFVGDRALQVHGQHIRAPKVVISAGSRSYVPDIPGLAEVPYQTSETIFEIKSLPKSIIFLGGGYKSCEFAHFFSAFGVPSTIIQRNQRLVPEEEPEISFVVRKKLGEHVRIFTSQYVTGVRRSGNGVQVVRKDAATGEEVTEEAEMLVLGTGARGNADILNVQAAGVQASEMGYVEVNEYLETTAPGVWALGDITGRHLFRHTANYESQVVWYNMTSGQRTPVDEHAIPHAVYTYPTVGSVGLTEEMARKVGYKVLVGFNRYANVAKGNAMADDHGLLKVVVEKGTRRIIGAHIVGKEADLLVQQIVYLMNSGDQTYLPMGHSQVIHPALSEAVAGAFARLVDPDDPGHVHHH